MGLHPFDWGTYVDRERDAESRRLFNRAQKISDVLRYAVQEEGVTMTQVDHSEPVAHRLHLQALWETEQETDMRIGMVAFIAIPLTLDGESISGSDRFKSTYFLHDEMAGGQRFRKYIYNDDIVLYGLGGKSEGLVTPETVPPFTREEAERFEIDYMTLERYLGFFEGCDILVADPGETDLLAMTGRFDLIREYIDFMRPRYKAVIPSVHHPGVTLPLLEAENIPVDGYITMLNGRGTYMFPTPELALDAITHTKKPIIAIKPMAGGRYLGHKAFEYVFNTVGVEATMFGMGTIDQVKETIGAAKGVLGVD